MKRINCIPLIAFILYAALLYSCNKEEPDPIKTNPTEEEVLEILRESGRYTVGEHSCMVEVSTDSYVFPTGLARYDPVPEEQFVSMSTLGIIETILEHPGYNTLLGRSYKEAIYFFSANSSPGLLEELFNRNDAVGTLIGRYLEMYSTCAENNYSTNLGKGVPDGYSFPSMQLIGAFNGIQVLIAQYDILDKVTEEEIDSLSVHLVRTYLSGNDQDGLFHGLAGSSSLWLAMRIMEHEGYRPLLNNIGSLRSYLSGNGTGLLSSEYRAWYWLMFNDFIEERLGQ